MVTSITGQWGCPQKLLKAIIIIVKWKLSEEICRMIEDEKLWATVSAFVGSNLNCESKQANAFVFSNGLEESFEANPFIKLFQLEWMNINTPSNQSFKVLIHKIKSKRAYFLVATKIGVWWEGTFNRRLYLTYLDIATLRLVPLKDKSKIPCLGKWNVHMYIILILCH